MHDEELQNVLFNLYSINAGDVSLRIIFHAVRASATSLAVAGTFV